MTSVGLISRNRLRNIPAEERARHELCFYLHDEGTRLLVEYEAAQANIVTIDFPDIATSKRFQRLADKKDPIGALRECGFTAEARKVVLNQITMALASDCLHHIYESLRCFEKRKFVVAFNLLRKPLKDNLSYLAWMLGDEDDFYAHFTSGNPEALSQKRIGNFRRGTLKSALSKTAVANLLNADFLHELLYDRKSKVGFEEYFQHAVHLITVENLELKTSAENFNFIFKSPYATDTYHWLYLRLPYVMLFLLHLLIELFKRIKPMDKPAYSAATVRSILAFMLVTDVKSDFVTQELAPLSDHYKCETCKATLKLTRHNALKIVLRQSFRCAKCGKQNDLPFSWLF